jgi:ATP-dependent Clp protease ATP-binding subunit ClpA
MMTGAAMGKLLDLTKRSEAVAQLVEVFGKRIIGQPEATEALANIMENYYAGLCDPTRPIGNALFLGPTGTGKTRTVEALCEALFGDSRACIKIDCAEFAHSHEIAKLIGSPPGYLGHRETPPLFTQEALNSFHTETLKVTVILFDEIEKASDALWSLMLGIMDKATLTLGDNRRVDFSKTVIVMTSNIGAAQISDVIKGGFGFHSNNAAPPSEDQMKKIATSAAKSKFNPEFMNRIDNIVTFHTLTEENIREIMAIEMGLVQSTMWSVGKFLYYVTPAVKSALFAEGYSREYGAREMKRAIEKHIRLPLARLLSTKQIAPTDRVMIDVDEQGTYSYTLKQIEPRSQIEGDNNVLSD